MPRTIDATLEATLASGTFSAFFQLIVGSPAQYLQVVSFKLTPFGELTAKAVSSTEIPDIDLVILRRGVIVNGTQYYLDTSSLYATKITYDGHFYNIEADVIAPTKVSIAADVSYTTLLTNFANSFSYSINRRNSSASFWGNQFYPSGKSLTLNRADQLRAILKQKFFMGCTDYGSNTIRFFFADESSSDGTITVKNLIKSSYSQLYGLNQNIGLLWRNDGGTIYQYNLPEVSIYNLGYIKDNDYIPYGAGTLTTATATAGQRLKVQPHLIEPITLAPNLEYLTGDQVKIVSSTTGQQATGTLLVEEYLDSNKEPSWGIRISLWDYIANTEGGALPSTIERSAPYTPLNTSQFSAILSATDNNIQAAMDTLDDHDHSGLATTEGIQDTVGAMVSSNTETGITVTYDDTNGKLNFDAQTAGDARYAPIAKGVTNGDSHDHNGGDGAAITDANLSTSDITTNDASTSKHGFLKKLSNVASEFISGTGSWTRLISAVQQLFTHGNSGTVPASTTYYLPLYTPGLVTAVANLTVTRACTAANLYFTINSTQPASGSLVITMLKGGVATTLVITIAASSVAGTYSNLVNQISLAASDSITLEVKNNATAASATITRVAMELIY